MSGRICVFVCFSGFQDEASSIYHPSTWTFRPTIWFHESLAWGCRKERVLCVHERVNDVWWHSLGPKGGKWTRMKSKIVREVLIKNFFYQFASSKDRSLLSFLDIVVIKIHDVMPVYGKFRSKTGLWISRSNNKCRCILLNNQVDSIVHSIYFCCCFNYVWLLHLVTLFLITLSLFVFCFVFLTSSALVCLRRTPLLLELYWTRKNKLRRIWSSIASR